MLLASSLKPPPSRKEPTLQYARRHSRFRIRPDAGYGISRTCPWCFCAKSSAVLSACADRASAPNVPCGLRVNCRINLPAVIVKILLCPNQVFVIRDYDCTTLM